MTVNHQVEISKLSLPSKVSAVRNKYAQSIVAKNIGAEDTNKGPKSHPPYTSQHIGMQQASKTSHG